MKNYSINEHHTQHGSVFVFGRLYIVFSDSGIFVSVEQQDTGYIAKGDYELASKRDKSWNLSDKTIELERRHGFGYQRKRGSPGKSKQRKTR